jgi:hypothetical protein
LPLAQSSREARAIEEACVTAHGSSLENKIHSLSPENGYYELAVEWGENWLVEHDFPTQ